ncbi:hypothetical protein EU538_07125, partial [Candidatus Thorarchaeota archaeon]
MWKNESLDRLFNPKSIAVIGASDKAEKLGALTLVALADYSGKVFPVNPRLDKIGNLKCYPRIDAIGQKIDLAIMALGPRHIIPAMEECADAGVGGAIIFSAGFKELGQDGAEAQSELRRVAESGKIAVIGPNCLGAGNVNLSLNATFFPHPVGLRKGSVAIISQSGGVSGLMLYRAADNGVGVSKFASVGNRVNIDFADLLRYLRDDSETSTVCMFVEGTEKGRQMYSEMLETTRKKPVLVFKVGKTPASREAALSHTGSMAGKAEIYSAAIKQAGGLELPSISDMMDTAKVVSTANNIPPGNKVAVITHSLGIALIAAQTLEENGMELPTPESSTADKIESLLEMPVHVPIKNPIDLLAKGWAEPDVFARAFELVAEQPDYDALLTVFSPNYQEGIGGGMPVEKIVDGARKSKKLVVSVLNSPADRPPPGIEELEDGGIP